MCGCSAPQSGNAAEAILTNEYLTLHVDDMTCGHCAGTIKKAVEAALPGTQVDANPTSKLVSVRGTADLSAVEAIVAGAGYAPSRTA